MFDFFFWETFWRLFQSPAGLGDVSISCGDVAENNFVRDISATSPRPAGDHGDCRRRRGDVAATEKTSRRRRWTAGDVAETFPQLRRRLGDVAATAGDVAETFPRLPGESWLSPYLETSPRRLLGESASHFLVSRVARFAATDQSRQSQRRLRQ